MPYTVRHAHLPNPIEASIQKLDLHIGVVYEPHEPAERYVGVMLQPPGALLVEDKVGAMLPDWPAVVEVMAGLMDQGRLAWGPLPSSGDKTSYEQVVLMLGETAGALTRHEIRDRLVQRVHDGRLKAGYVTLLRDQLSAVLREAGVEAGGAS